MDLGSTCARSLRAGLHLKSIAAYVPDLVFTSLRVEDTVLIDSTLPVPRVHVIQGCIAYIDVPALGDALFDYHGRISKSDTVIDSVDGDIFKALLTATSGELQKIVARNGGDVIRVHGGSVLVAAFPRESGDLAHTCILRAVKTAVEIRFCLKAQKITAQVGIGFGSIHMLHVGGIGQQMHAVTAGDAIIQAAYACTESGKRAEGQIILSKAAKIKSKGNVPCRNIDVRGARYTAPLFQTDVRYGEVKYKPFPPHISDEERFAGAGATPLGALLRADMKTATAETVLLRYVCPLAQMDLYDEERWWTGRVVDAAVIIQVCLRIAIKNGRDGHQALQQSISILQIELRGTDGIIVDITVECSNVIVTIGFGLPPTPGVDTIARTIDTAVEFAQGATTNLGLFEQCCAMGIELGEVRCGSAGSNTRRHLVIQGVPLQRASRLMTLSMGLPSDTIPVDPPGVLQRVLCGPVFAAMAAERVPRIRFVEAAPGTGAGDGELAGGVHHCVLGPKTIQCLPYDANADAPDSAAVGDMVHETFSRATRGGLRFLTGAGFRDLAHDLTTAARSAAMRRAIIWVDVDPCDAWVPLSPWKCILSQLIQSRCPAFDPLLNQAGSTALVDALCKELSPELYRDVALLNDLLGISIVDSSAGERRDPRARWIAKIALIENLIWALISAHPNGHLFTIVAPLGLDPASLLVAESLTLSGSDANTLCVIIAQETIDSSNMNAIKEIVPHISGLPTVLNTVLKGQNECMALLSSANGGVRILHSRQLPAGDLAILLRRCLVPAGISAISAEISDWVVKHARSARNPTSFVRLCAHMFIADVKAGEGDVQVVAKELRVRSESFFAAFDLKDPRVIVARRTVERFTRPVRTLLRAIGVLGPTVPYAALAIRSENGASLWRDICALVEMGVLRPCGGQQGRLEFADPFFSKTVMAAVTPADCCVMHSDQVRFLQLGAQRHRDRIGELLLHSGASGVAFDDRAMEQSEMMQVAGLVPKSMAALADAIDLLHTRSHGRQKSNSVHEPNISRKLHNVISIREGNQTAFLSGTGELYSWRAWPGQAVRRISIESLHYALSADDGSALQRVVYEAFPPGALSWPSGMHVLNVRGTDVALVAFLINRKFKLSKAESDALVEKAKAEKRLLRCRSQAALERGPRAKILSIENVEQCPHCNTRITDGMQVQMRKGIQVRVYDPACPHRSHHRVSNHTGWMPRAPTLMTTGALPSSFDRVGTSKTDLDRVANYMMRHKSFRQKSFKRPPQQDVTIEVRLLAPVNYHGHRMQRPKSKLNLLLCGV